MGTSSHNVIENAQLLADFFELRFDARELMRRRNLSPLRFVEFWEDPVVVRTIAAWESARQFHLRDRARDHQLAAAHFLHDAMRAASDPVESRRAATPLARLSTAMSKLPRTSRARPEAVPGTPDLSESASEGPGSSSAPGFHHSAGPRVQRSGTNVPPLVRTPNSPTAPTRHTPASLTALAGAA